ncbi:MAG: methyltransferase [Clostridia bacterium]|nr:methyltransferase [Clostridia bacterium]
MIHLSSGEVLDELLIDNFKIVQNVNFYRFTSDSVLLSKFAKAKMGDEVADFCSGSGIVGLHFYALNQKTVKRVTLFEMQPELYDMSLKTISLNGLEEKFSAVNCKVQEIPKEYTEKFSLILCNPPYEKGGFENKDYKKAVCRKELFLTLSELATAASRCLKFGGRFVLCHRADRLAEVVYTLHAYGMEVKRIQPVAGRREAEPYLVLIEAVKGGKAGVKLLPTCINEPPVKEIRQGGTHLRSLL